MFSKLNLYTALTFVVYPIFFTGILIYLLFPFNKGDEINLSVENSSIVNEGQEFQENIVSHEPFGMKDSLSNSNSDFRSPNYQ